MTKESAVRLIRMAIYEFHRDIMVPLHENIHMYDRTTGSTAIKMDEEFSSFSDAVDDLYDGMSKGIEEMDNFQTSQLLSLCRDIGELYSLPVFERMPQFIPDSSLIRYVDPGTTDADYNAVNMRYGGKAGNTIEKLMVQIEKFGDEELCKRLAEVKSGQSRIVFREMEDGTEGHTAVDGGIVTYRLNRKYEGAADEAGLLRAVMILAHELQRDPGTGDTVGETGGIVMRNLAFAERLASGYGEKVYTAVPEFGIMHYLRELFGEGSLKEFAAVAFSHAGSYWKLNEEGGLTDNGTVDVRDREGTLLYQGGGGRQKTLETWLGLKDTQVWQHLLKPAGYEYEPGAVPFKWTKTPGIPRAVIEGAYAAGQLSDGQYAAMTGGQNGQAAEEVPEEAAGSQDPNMQGLLESFRLALEMQVQQDLFMTNAVNRWPWVKLVYGKLEEWAEAARSLGDRRSAVNEAEAEPEAEEIIEEPPQPGDREPIGSTAEFKRKYGSTIETKAAELGVDPDLLGGVILAESKGTGFENEKLVIRFENHVFIDKTKAYADYSHFFSYNAVERWKEHKFRKSDNDEWQDAHKGGQAGEYEVFDFAKTLNEEAAYKSISMGLGQIMGGNYETCRFGSAMEMFEDFSIGHENQLEGMFKFIRYNRGGDTLTALRNGDKDTFVKHYNGSGKVDEYTKIMDDREEEYKNA